MTDQNRCAVLMIVGLVALVAVIALIMLFFQEKQSESHMPLLASCVPDSVAAKQVASGEWMLWKSSCCPQMRMPCPVDRRAYDLVIPVNAINHF